MNGLRSASDWEGREKNETKNYGELEAQVVPQNFLIEKDKIFERL